jgi:hypothetical protein
VLGRADEGRTEEKRRVARESSAVGSAWKSIECCRAALF